VDIPTTGFPRHAPARLAAQLKRPGTFIRYHLVRLLSRLTGRIDPGEAIAYEEAARAAFRTGTLVDSRDFVTRRSSEPRSGPAGPQEDPSGPVARLTEALTESGATDSTGAASTPPTNAPESEVAWAERLAAEDRLPGRNQRQADSSAPDYLLRTPTSVAPVADDFFDGLIRRVEGDR
jgi:hypothetical protein